MTINVGWTVSVTTDVIATTVVDESDIEPNSAREDTPGMADPDMDGFLDRALSISSEPAGWREKRKSARSWLCRLSVDGR